MRISSTRDDAPKYKRKRLMFESAKLEGVNDSGEDIFAVTISNNTCELTIHRVRRIDLDRFIAKEFDIGIWEIVEC